MEWIKEYEEAEPGHRHMSHLFGLHPGTQITPETPELFAAARKTLEQATGERRRTYRLEQGMDHQFLRPPTGRQRELQAPEAVA
ncbi:MAG: hypothetical protein MZV63_61000 [Marinilabiliales bacterium]|nr:hypothetical protein [Marinilabiliales bacterium]